MGGCVVSKRNSNLSKKDREIVPSFHVIKKSTLESTHNNSNNTEPKQRKTDVSTAQNTPIHANTQFSTPVKNGKELYDDKLKKSYDSKFKVSATKNDFISVNIQVNNYDIQIPVWLEKNQILKFEVKGMWSLSNELGYCMSDGYSKNKSTFRNYNIGSLLGRVLGGSYFEIKNNSSVKVDNYGPLYLCTNTKEYFKDTDGCLEIKIYGCSSTTIEQDLLDEKLGWDIKNNIVMSFDNGYLEEEELNFINLLNKLRSNPGLFADIYLKHLSSKGKNYKELFEYIKSLPQINLLTPNKFITSVSKIHAVYIGESGSTGAKSENYENLKQRLVHFGLNPDRYSESQVFGYSSAFDILMFLLLDEYNKNKTNRTYLLSKEFSSIGVAYNTHIVYDYVCDIIYTSKIDERENLLEKFNEAKA